MDILKRTFTAYRISVVVEPPPANVLSQRLRDRLAGDTVRGVEIRGAETVSGADAGALTAVDWQIVSADNGESDLHHGGAGPTHRVEIIYERGGCLAYLFVSRKLLLFSGPAPVRGTFVRFLTQALDTRASVLVPDSDTLAGVFEAWLGGQQDDESATTLSAAQKDVVITLRFGDEAGGGALRTLDITIPAEDISAFAGTAGGVRFSDRLASYLDKHLALNIKHADVRIAKISCGGFVLGEGKVKLLDEAKVAEILDGIK
ncbi:hypothetical protein LQW54_000361 [Pestalotiopsis sp. IQ-011]